MRKLKGLVGQGMDGGRRVTAQVAKVLKVTASGAGTIVAPEFETMCEVYGVAGGGGGQLGNSGGCGGGGAFYKRFRCRAGAVVGYAVGAGGAAGNSSAGAAGGDTTVALPSGQVVRATGGANDVSGLGGSGIGGDMNRRGGNGGFSTADNGLAGEGGGAGGEAGSSSGGGGGGAGFNELGELLPGGRGGDNLLGIAGVAPGGGGHGNNGAGATGAIAFVFTKISNS